jgi:GMP synthase-like glutamine amidotransferase
MAKQTENQKPNLVLGRVVDKLNHPLANLIVQAFASDLRDEELLDECITNMEIQQTHRDIVEALAQRFEFIATSTARSANGNNCFNRNLNYTP